MAIRGKVGEAFIDVRASVKKLRGDLRKAGRITSQKLKAVGAKLRSVGRGLTFRVTAPLALVGTAAGKMAADVDDAMAKIIGLVGVGAEEVAGFRKEILKLSGETAKSPRELANAMFFITSAGLRGKDALEALEASAKAAAAGLGETKEVADAATSAMNAYGAENLSASGAVSILVRTVREGKAEASAIAGSLGKVIPVAAELGLQFQEVGATIAAMTRIGFNARTATTGLRSLLLQLIKPSEGAKEVVSELGLSFAQLRQTLRQDGLLNTLALLREASGGNVETLSTLIPNVRALNGLMALTGKNAEATQQIFKSLSQTTEEDLNAAFSVAAETGGFKFRQALAKIQSSLVRIGDAILPAVVPMVTVLTNKITELATKFSELAPETQKFIVFGSLAAATLGPLLIVLGVLVSTFGTFISILSLVGSVGLPVLAVFGAIAAAAGLIIMNWKPIVAFFKGVWEKIKNIFSNAKAFVIQARDDIIKGFTGIQKTISNKVKALVDGITKKVVSLKKTIPLEIELMIGKIKSKFLDLKIKGLELFEDFTSGVLKKTNEMFMEVVGGSIIPDMIDGIKGEFKDLGDFFAGGGGGILDKGTDLFNQLKEKTGGLIGGAAQGVKGAAKGIAGFFTGGKAGDIFSDLGGGAGSFFDKLKDIFGKLAGFLKDLFSDLIEAEKGEVEGPGSAPPIGPGRKGKALQVFKPPKIEREFTPGFSGSFGESLGGFGFTTRKGRSPFSILGQTGGFFQRGGRIGRGELGIVGEAGPEAFIPGTSGQIISNDQLREALGSQVNFSQENNFGEGFDQVARAEIKSMLGKLKEQIKAGLQSDMLEGSL